MLEQESSMPSPILVKRKYKEIMNRYAIDESFDQPDSDSNKTEAQKKADKKAKKKAKKDLKSLPPKERKIEEDKLKNKEAYDCLMFSQCSI